MIYLKQYTDFKLFLTDESRGSLLEESINPLEASLKVSKRCPWSDVEINIAYKAFNKFIFSTEQITLRDSDIRAMIEKNPIYFKGRNLKSIRTWLTCRRKKEQTKKK